MISHHHDKEFTYNSNGQLYFSIEDGVASEFYWYGNQLRKIKKVNDIIELQYDDNGYRVSKTIYKNGIEISNTKYIIEGNKILKEIKHFNDDENDYVITYIYDGNEIIGFKYNNSLYIYNKNILGEINEIICRGNVVATYKYDAWGVPKAYRENGTIPDTDATFIGNLNSIKYKGYVYDVETNLALVSTRYYSPELGRFIQPADVSSLNPQSINGLNLYAYANNNPIGLAYSSSGVGFSDSGAMLSLLSLGGLSSFGNNLAYSNSFNIFAGLSMPQLFSKKSLRNLTKDFFVNIGEVLGRVIWGLTKNGHAFSNFHYAADGINGYTLFDNLPSTSGKIFKGLGIALMINDVFEAGYKSCQNGHSFGQGALNVGLTAGKNYLIYKASIGITTAVGTWAGAKLGASLGSFAGPVGMVIGVIAGIAVGWLIDEFGDAIIDWVVGWFD